MIRLEFGNGPGSKREMEKSMTNVVTIIHYTILARQVQGYGGNLVKDEEAFCSSHSWTGEKHQLAWIDANDDGEPQIEVRKFDEDGGVEPIYVQPNPTLHDITDTVYGLVMLES